MAAQQLPARPAGGKTMLAHGSLFTKVMPGAARERRVTRCKVAAALIGACVLLGPDRPWSGPASAAPNPPSQSHGNGRMIRLAGQEFDPLVEVPPPPHGLRQERPGRGEAAYYIVQFGGRITPVMRHDLEETGALPLHYVHENAFIVRADERTIELVAGLPSVRWTGPYEAGYKLDGRLDRRYDDELNRQIDARRKLGAGRALPRVDTSAHLAVLILTMEKGRVAEVARAAEQAGGAGLQRSEQGSGLVRAEIPRAALERLARETGVLWIERELPAEVNNDIARWTIQSHDSVTRAAPVHQHQVTGSGQIVTISDTGLDYDHVAFKDPAYPAVDPNHRKVTAYYTPTGATGNTRDSGPTQHGTHVSGSVAGNAGVWGQFDGDGFDSGNPAQEKLEPHDGQAFGARIHIQDISNDPYGEEVYPSSDLSDHYSAALGRDSWINTNSWGTSFFLGEYLAPAASTDTFIWDHPAFSVLFSAGNNGPGLGTINPFAIAKNLIAVGASANGPASEDLAFGTGSFSSRGPADDGRIKPDVMAPGESLWSARGCDGNIPGVFPPVPVCASGDFDTYQAISGTSMAAPTAAGAAALVRQYYMGGWYPTGDPATGTPMINPPPSAALIKATLINSAAEMTADEAYAHGELRYPNDNQGWGRILLDDALYFPGDKRLLVVDDNAGVTTGQTNSYQFNVGSRFQPFEVTLVWSDRPRTAPTGPDLVNDLDLVVTAPNGTVYRGNVYVGYRPGQSKANAVPAETDHLNNVESVLVLPNIQPGPWTIQVVGGNVPFGDAQNRQPYALVMTGRKTTSLGLVEMDKPEYRAFWTVALTVGDADQNQDPSVAESLTMQMSSTTETSPMNVTLMELGTDSGVFAGTVPLQFGLTPISGDPYLQVQYHDVITASYFDANDGSGGSGTRQATASVDEEVPVISNLAVSELRPTRAVITWTTDEPADSRVDYGASIPPTSTVSSPLFTTSHSMELRGLMPGVKYYYLVQSADDLGNNAVVGGGPYLTFTTPAVPANPPISPDWPTYQNNSARRGASTSLMVPPLSLQWSVATNTNFVINSAPVVSGTLVYTVEGGFVRARQIADGALEWERQLGDPGQWTSTAAISGGLVYVPLALTVDDPTYGLLQKGFLYALNASTGVTAWTYTYSGDARGINSLFKIAVEGGRVFTINYNQGVVIAVNAANGTLSWTRPLSQRVVSQGAAVGDGRVYVPASAVNQATVIALDQTTGVQLWERVLDAYTLPGHVPLFAEGTVYAGTGMGSPQFPGTILALNATDGTIRWQVDGFDQVLHTTPAYDGSTIYFATADTSSYGYIVYMALDASTGNALWSSVVPPVPYGTSGSLVHADGFLYGVADDGALRAIDATTGAIVSTYSLGEVTDSAHVAVSGRTIFVESKLGTLYAVQAQVDPDGDNDGDPDTTDCASLNPAQRHGAVELCNGVDDDCVGGIDDGFGQTTCGTGLCQRTVDNCFNGQPQSCVPGTPGVESIASPETCYDSLDNNCDGFPDLDCAINIVPGSQVLGGGATIVYGGESYLYGQSLNNIYEQIQEGGSGSSRTLTAVWTYSTTSVPAGTLCELRMEGTRGSANDAFPFYVVKRSGTGNCVLGEAWPGTAALTLTKTSDDDRPQIADLGTPLQTYCIKVTDSLPTGDSQPDIVSLDRVFVFPTPVSISETTQMGTMASGGFTKTHRSDNLYEQLTESLVNGVSRLRHTWRFDNVPSGTNRKLHIEGNRSAGSDKDDFQFYVSTSTQNPPPDSSFVAINGAIINANGDTAGGADFSFTYSSPFYTTVWIRVEDTKTNSGTALSSLFLDHLAIKTVP
jgi:outer membrane protein assembly factor BamB